MKEKIINRLWAVSLCVLAAITLVLLANKHLGLALSDTLIRVFGILELIGLPTLVITTTLKFVKKK